MSGYREFLNRIRERRLPLYGTVHWTGETGEVHTAVNFELHRQEPVATVAERAYRYLSQLSEAEAAALDIEVIARDGKPVRAVLKPRRDAPAVINTDRLRELGRVLKNP